MPGLISVVKTELCTAVLFISTSKLNEVPLSNSLSDDMEVSIRLFLSYLAEAFMHAVQ